MFFASPTSNITPALVSVAMSRSDSRDSTSSAHNHHFTSHPMDVSYSTSPYHSYSMMRTSTSSIKSSSSIMQRRESTSSTSSTSSQWTSAPYRSCMHHSSSQEEQHEPSSYLSDDDLLYLECGGKALPVETIPSLAPVLRRKEMSTEEHIAMLRDQQEREQQFEQRRSSHQQKMVRFATEQHRVRRPSGQRRSTPVRRNHHNLNGPM